MINGEAGGSGLGREDVQRLMTGAAGAREQIRDSATPTRERRVAEAGATRFLSLDDATRSSFVTFRSRDALSSTCTCDACAMIPSQSISLIQSFANDHISQRLSRTILPFPQPPRRKGRNRSLSQPEDWGESESVVCQNSTSGRKFVRNKSVKATCPPRPLL